MCENDLAEHFNMQLPSCMLFQFIETMEAREGTIEAIYQTRINITKALIETPSLLLIILFNYIRVRGWLHCVAGAFT